MMLSLCKRDFKDLASLPQLKPALADNPRTKSHWKRVAMFFMLMQILNLSAMKIGGY